MKQLYPIRRIFKDKSLHKFVNSNGHMEYAFAKLDNDYYLSLPSQTGCFFRCLGCDAKEVNNSPNVKNIDYRDYIHIVESHKMEVMGKLRIYFDEIGDPFYNIDNILNFVTHLRTQSPIAKYQLNISSIFPKDVSFEAMRSISEYIRITRAPIKLFVNVVSTSLNKKFLFCNPTLDKEVMDFSEIVSMFNLNKYTMLQKPVLRFRIIDNLDLDPKEIVKYINLGMFQFQFIPLNQTISTLKDGLFDYKYNETIGYLSHCFKEYNLEEYSEVDEYIASMGYISNLNQLISDYKYV